MQCPNCRHIENGQWLYANGCRQRDELILEDIINEEEYDEEFKDIGKYLQASWNEGTLSGRNLRLIDYFYMMDTCGSTLSVKREIHNGLSMTKCSGSRY